MKQYPEPAYSRLLNGLLLVRFSAAFTSSFSLKGKSVCNSSLFCGGLFGIDFFSGISAASFAFIIALLNGLSYKYVGRGGLFFNKADCRT